MTLFIGICTVYVSAKDETEYRKELYDLYISGKMADWQPVLSEMLVDKSVSSKEARIRLLTDYYGLIGHLIDKKRKEEASVALKSAWKLEKALENSYPGDAKILALKGNLVGFQIAMSPLKATTMASGMLRDVKKAYAKAPGDALVNILYGNIRFYMPGMFGGYKTEALSCYKKARKTMEADSSALKNNWLYVQLLVTIGLVYEKDEQYAKAKEMYAWVIKHYPAYAYVKETLYPRVKDK